MSLKIHAIILALNEETFISNQLATLYPFCSGISILTQYDRDWYGKRVTPDGTLRKVSDFPDPEGKIHLVLRRWRDQAAALNCEMGAWSCRPSKRVQSHGCPPVEIVRFHATPDYFWIVDADEFYDSETVPKMLQLLGTRRPRGMRVHGYNYVKTWNRRVPMEQVRFCQFGFVRPGVTFTCRRQVTWNESRLQKLLLKLKMPDFSAAAFGFLECPKEIAVFHHGCWLGGRARMQAKAAKSTHTDLDKPDYADSLARIPFELVANNKLPDSILRGDWPDEFFEGINPSAQRSAKPYKQ